MEQKQIVSSSVYNQIPPLSANYQWIVAQNLDAEAENETEFQIFYNVHDPLHHYRCQIPELMGKQVRGCFYGWVILCDHPRNLMWSLWNLVTSKVIHLPRLVYKQPDSDDDSDHISFVVLTSPPDDPNSLLLMTRAGKPHFVFCRLHPKKKELGWTERSYAEQVEKLKDVDTLLSSLICFNGKVYAIAINSLLVLELSIVVKDTGVAINLLSSLEFPDLPGFGPGGFSCAYLVGTCKDIFVIFVDFDNTKTIRLVRLFKLDMNSTTFEELEALQDATIYMDLEDYLRPQFYSLAIGSELRGYIHILDKNGRDIHSYHVKDKTISLSSLPGLAGRGYVSSWAMLGGGSIARKPSKTDPVTFDDLEGVDEAKAELMEIVSCFKGDSTYVNLGAKIPRSVLLVGPSRTGKTLLASRIRDLFKEVRKHASSIIFIDELDAVSLKSGNGFNIEGDQTLNQLLTEMDGFESDKVVVIAATMRLEMLASALLRAGRFSRNLFVKEPDEVFNMVECKRLLEGDHKQEEDKKDKIVVSKVKSNEVKFIGTADESHLLNLPYDVLEIIIESCVGLEYMNFRASCKLCYLAAPIVHQTASKRFQLQEYSLVSPWLMVLEKHTITLIDPMSGDKYFIKTPHKSELVGELLIHCSRYGWLLMRKYDGPLFFFNPFTSDTHMLPEALDLDSFDFSAPPTSPYCIVVGFASLLRSQIHIHFAGRESSWRTYTLNCSNLYRFPAFYGGDIYALRNGKGVDAFKSDLGVTDQNCRHVCVVLDEASIISHKSKAQHFLVKCDHEYKCHQHFILVIVGEFGESVEVFIPDEPDEGFAKWVKIDDIGRHMIYVGDQTCLCMEAKTAKMENKIYFPRLQSGKMVFYSLETRKFHTFNGGNISESFTDFFGTIKHLPPYIAWIEPAWS